MDDLITSLQPYQAPSTFFDVCGCNDNLYFQKTQRGL